MAQLPIKIPISGGPHAGKTTLFNALRNEYPDAYFVPEPATNVIERELAREQLEIGYTPRVPWVDYTKFGPLVSDESKRLERRIPTVARMAFLDRSLIDTIAYAKLNNFDEFVPVVQARVSAAKYTLAFFCEPVEGYETNGVRRETVEDAMRTHDYLAEAYDQSGIEVVHLPAFSGVEKEIAVAMRISLVRAAVEAYVARE